MSRADTIFAMCKKQASHMGSTSYPALSDLYEQSIRTLCSELDTLNGRNAMPKAGCFHVWCFAGDADVLVEFDHQPEERETHDEPGCPEVVTPIQVLINGRWIDSDSFDSHIQESWVVRGHEWLQEQREEAQIERAEREMDYA